VDGDVFLPLIRRWALLLVAAAVAAGVVGWAAASQISPTYEARARLLVGPLNTDIDTLRASGELTRTYAELASGAQVLAGAAAAMGPSVTADQLRRSVQANANDVTRLLTIRVTSRDPALAAKAADAIAGELIRLTSGTGAAPAPPAGIGTETAPAPAPAAGIVTSVDPAEVPDHRVAPDVRVHVLLSMLAGILMAMAIAFVIETFGRGRVRAGEPARRGMAMPPATPSHPSGTLAPAWTPSRQRVEG
jgi:capsular polysaccharide biosynthesis protein